VGLSNLAQKVLGRERVNQIARFAYLRGIVIQSPMHSLEGGRDADVLEGEYIRASSLDLVAREIRERQVPGAVAEVGVYRGEFARLINIAFPDRKLYLFDTFSGLPGELVKEDVQKEFISRAAYSQLNSKTDFSMTSVALVISRMRHKENCIVMPGLFPQSAQGCDAACFAFVSVDCDLHRPIYDSLQFFYPRLSHGGYIFVHDYNNQFFGGAKIAVRQFAEERHLSYFPLSDASGSAVFSKP
jgi:O-methyltransferase